MEVVQDVDMKQESNFEVSIGLEQLIQKPASTNSTSSQPSTHLKSEVKSEAVKQSQSLQQSAAQATGREVKFREVVRDKEKRRNLKGQACFRCKQFYRALGCEEDAVGADMCNECSRHRDNNAIQNTPP